MWCATRISARTIIVANLYIRDLGHALLESSGLQVTDETNQIVSSYIDNECRFKIPVSLALCQSSFHFKLQRQNFVHFGNAQTRGRTSALIFV